MKLNKVFLLCALVLSGCNKTSNNNSVQPDGSDGEHVEKPVMTLADKWAGESGVVEHDLNQSIFITNYDIPIDREDVDSIGFKIEPKANSVASPLKGVYSGKYLSSLESQSGDIITVPVYGMYSSYVNTIDFEIKFKDQSVYNFHKELSVPVYQNFNNKLERLDIIQTPSKPLSFSYYAMQSKTTQGMVIADVDGNIRWVFNEDKLQGLANRSGLFYLGEFVRQYKDWLVFQSLTGKEHRIQIKSHMTLMTPHHEINIGRDGLLLNVSGYIDGERKRESVLLEVNPKTGTVLKTWDLGKILSKWMTSNGDDPSEFVGSGIVRDWFHMNSAIYDSNDDTVIISSRENFIIKLDYNSGKPIWIFGDKTKIWGNYPSLFDIALKTEGMPPIGQHALSIEQNGNLLMFNNGHESEHQPEGKLTGESLTTSKVVSYRINDKNKSAIQTWSYDGGVKCDICSSVYRKDNDYLITYSSIDMKSPRNRHEEIRFISSDSSVEGRFQFYGMCLVWNAKIIEPNVEYVAKV
ncbi:aryl-sulfate sulfotransferase [Photobacterium damselae]|uniref:aryl-sulfate sulfotransferase n=1 Tax=Photobacterium damselae TaxID=38293 RepID=UPI001EED8C8A|nr:aryl-sulfate sulfotransferase [Photobacterium damselae]UKA04674.1 aryl-sulfate sulfotransferase [Photobacterium damselae subsp. damselae]